MTGQSIIIRTEANRDLAVKIVSKLKIDPDRPLEIIIQQHREKRSLSANALYWRWLGIISRETGNDPDALHEHFKRQYLEASIQNVMGKDVEVYSTAKLSIAEMARYMDRVHAWATHERIRLPLPEERQAA